jgi:hypothetical protein
LDRAIDVVYSPADPHHPITEKQARHMPDRFLNLSDGVAMVVTDLHGDRAAFDRVLQHFTARRERSEVQRLIFLGDLIHHYGPAQADASLSMVLDVMRLQAELGSDTVIMLLGNHELPHIYGLTLAKGEREFTPRFEHELNDHREAVLSFFRGLPFYVRTSAGVTLGHAGPAPEAALQAASLRYFDHDALLAEADALLANVDDLDGIYRQYHVLHGVPYRELAFRYLAVRDERDPRYTHLLRGFLISQRNRTFQTLWDAFFTQNERGLTAPAYVNACRAFLDALSVDAPAEQHFAVSGHIPTRGGHDIVSPFHLRVSTAAHAQPQSAGAYLLLDCARPISAIHELLPGLRPLHGEPR